MSKDILSFIVHYQYIGIFLALCLGIIGLPIPDEVLLTFSGYLISQGKMEFFLALLFAFAGAVSGITLSYVLGKKLGLPFLRKFGPKIGIHEDKIEVTQKYFQKYGNIVLLIGYFIPGVRHLSAYVAGISDMSWRKFMFYAYSGGLIWASFFLILGKSLGAKWKLVEEYAREFGLYALLIAAVIALVIWLIYRKKQKR
ncbi:alkaline phosphatase like protein [Fictibacillus macauensis ZFHKF-1]|uniref:Alkaline phosphatase like protein n=1 Tax=Fictibacillus macauensis ZFHKF-1 TaxID=1196324 RepID=I8UJR7_9BACL|nr:DedA family protein [Fictibacillus macauensis]EIT87120.1 alkaline phosphatase like protein [Fictibacillus macauensis ZFHKF-1]